MIANFVVSKLKEENKEEFLQSFRTIIGTKNVLEIFYNKRANDLIWLISKYFPIEKEFDHLSFDNQINNVASCGLVQAKSQLDNLEMEMKMSVESKIPQIFDNTFYQYALSKIIIHPVTQFSTSLKCDKIFYSLFKKPSSITKTDANALVYQLLKIGHTSRIEFLLSSKNPLLKTQAERWYSLYLCDLQSHYIHDDNGEYFRDSAGDVLGEESALSFIKKIGHDNEKSLCMKMLKKHLEWKEDNFSSK